MRSARSARVWATGPGRTCRPSRRARVPRRGASPPAASLSQPSPLLVGALVFVLRLGARGELAFPRRLVAVEGRVLVGRRVGLALVGPLLVVDHLRPLPAGGKSEQKRAEEHEPHGAHHDLPPCAAGAGPGGCAGAPAW